MVSCRTVVFPAAASAAALAVRFFTMNRVTFTSSESGGALPRASARRPWRARLGNALRGLKSGIRGQASFFAYFFFASLILAAALVLRCSLLEWCLLLAGIGMVLTVELFNSALVTLLQVLDERAPDKIRAAWEMAAGAVLVARLAVVAVVGLIFCQRLAALLMSSMP
jgi:diacylglycerol kinase (ATP)